MCVYMGEGGTRKDRRVNKMGRVSRIGSYAIASSMRDHHQQPCITCTTFNILAPIYKRINLEVPFCHFYSQNGLSLFFISCYINFAGYNGFRLNSSFHVLSDLVSPFGALFGGRGGSRIRVAVKVIIERIGYPGIIGYWICCYMRDLPSFAFRFHLLNTHF